MVEQVPVLDRAGKPLARRFTSRFDPRMSSGLTLYDPSIEAGMLPTDDIEVKMDPTIQKNLAMLDMTWSLPTLTGNLYDPETQSIAISMATQGEQHW